MDYDVTTKRIEKVAFVLSAVTLTFLYGYGAATFDWFPGSYVDRAVEQAADMFGNLHYVAPLVYRREGARSMDPSDIVPGYTLIATHFRDRNWRSGLKLIDSEGRAIHEWHADPATIFPEVTSIRGVRTLQRRGVHGSYLFPNGDVLLNLEYLGIVRLDACSNVIWRIQNGAHHSIERADDGTFWVPITAEAGTPVSGTYPDGYPGLKRPVNHDHLLRITEDGDPVDTISVLDVLYENDLVRYLAKARVVVSTDLTHVNDIEPLPRSLADEYPLFEAGDLLVSLRASDLVLVVDPETRVVKWYASDPFIQQHDPDFTGDGWIGIFNNNWDYTVLGTQLGGSQIIALQPHTDSLDVLYPTQGSDTFYTPFLGKWQQLEGGNMLLTEGRSGRVVEVTSDGRAVWEWINEPYDASRVVEVTEGSRHDLSSEQIANWPCHSEWTSSRTDGEDDET